jgi:hypothetical protein
MRKTVKHNKYSRKRHTRRGGMKNEPKKYPPLPESPTNRPPILTNNESLIPPQRESNEYKKRQARLVNTFSKARERTLLNKILGRKRPEPKLNSYGFPKSFFTVNNKVGFSKP